MKRYYLILLLLVLMQLLAALHSDDFPLGVYSYLQNGTPFFIQNRAELIRQMQKLGYNLNIIETNNSDKDLNELLKALDEAKIDAVLTDKCWSNDPKDPKHFSLVALSTSNYHRFEAEFTGAEAVQEKDNLAHEYWYGNSDQIPRVGRVFKDAGASYGHLWSVNQDQDKEGWAFTDIVYRFKDRKGNTVRLYDEMRFHKRHLESRADTDSLYISYRVKLSNLSEKMAPDTPLLSMEFYGFKGGRYDFGERIPGQKKIFYYRDYQALGQPTGFFDLNYSVSYNELRERGLMTDDFDNNPDTPPHWWWYVLRHLAPGLYWHANHDLALDYIDFEDQLHRNLRQDTAFYQKGINARIRQHLELPNGRIIKYLYSMDEPFQTHLDAFKRLQNLLDPQLPPVITASYDIRHREYKQAKDHYWQYQDVTRKIAEPQHIMPDIYPIQPEIHYDPYAGDNFLQNVLDHKLIRYYRDSKIYSQGRGEFLPIVQSFGYWSGSQWYSWILPPKATQKALLMLPLCYGADAIFHYQLQGAVNSQNQAGYYAPLISVDAQKLESVPYVYEVVEELNPRAHRLGAFLKDWDWIDAVTAMTDGHQPKLDLKAKGISTLSVKRSPRQLYEGYIESGFYENKKGQKALFVVNRRTDYFVWGLSHRHPNFTAPADYHKAYRQFEGQKLVIQLDKANKKARVKDFESGKIYKAKKRKIEITLEAGEAKLLIFE